MNAPTVTMSGITKRFGPFVALDMVDLAVEPGTLHAVVGENGAGKTTLMRVLQGTYRADEGSVMLNGEELHLRSAQDGYRHGIGMVSQHYSIIPELTCLQNLVLGGEPGAMIDWNRACQRANELARKLGMEFDWNSEARALSPAGAQKLEILKLLWRNSRVMILDEPTAMLSPLDSDALYENLKLFVNEGATVIVVTHRLPEVMQHCDEITVLRGGKCIATRKVCDTNTDELAELIIGRSMSPAAPHAPKSTTPAVALEIKDLTVRGDRGHDAVQSASFSIAAGEVVGIAGVDGNGQRELFHALIGRLAPTSGAIRLFGSDVTKDAVQDRLIKGFRMIAEDRHDEAVVEAWNLMDNALLGHQHRPELTSGKTIDRGSLREFTTRLIDRFRAKASGVSAKMGSLSGGNQQRVVAARALEFSPSVVLAFQPTRGLDIAATQDVYEAIRSTCESGAAALIVSFDLDELLEHCDRVIVINHGIVTVPSADGSRDRATLGRLMVAS